LRIQDIALLVCPAAALTTTTLDFANAIRHP
jgi:hypothetical protein